MKKPTTQCPYCGEAFFVLKENAIPTHDFPRPCRQVCPGSGAQPRRRGSPLWKDDPQQRERDFLEQVHQELTVYGFAIVKQVAALRGDGHSEHKEMPCPLCGQLLKYSVAEINGHCRAKCSRDGCINIME